MVWRQHNAAVIFNTKVDKFFVYRQLEEKLSERQLLRGYT